MLNNVRATKKAAEEGSPGTSILIRFRYFFPYIFISFFLLFFILIAWELFISIFSVWSLLFLSSIISVVPKEFKPASITALLSWAETPALYLIQTGISVEISFRGKLNLFLGKNSAPNSDIISINFFILLLFKE